MNKFDKCPMCSMKMDFVQTIYDGDEGHIHGVTYEFVCHSSVCRNRGVRITPNEKGQASITYTCLLCAGDGQIGDAGHICWNCNGEGEFTRVSNNT